MDKASSLVQSPPPGCVPMRDVIWLGDAIVLTQDYVEAPNLLQHSLYSSDRTIRPEQTLQFLLKLVQAIVALHDHGLAHGDLKPENILIEGEGNGGFVPLLVDLLDFSCEADGDVRNTAYAPATGGRFERDRFATTKVVEEILSKSNIEPGVIASD